MTGPVFMAKVQAHRLRRAARDLVDGPPRLGRGGSALGAAVGTSRTRLWSEPELAERAMQLGKVENLRVACRRLDGLLIPAGVVFSVWRQLGPPLSVRGYVPGRMLQGGCMVPAVAGGLCQLSNALYDVALQAGCRIVERHAHSRAVPGSTAVAGRDATLAWNYVDLRFAPAVDMRLSTRLDRDALVVRLFADRVAGGGGVAPSRDAGIVARSCATCHVVTCRRVETGPARSVGARVFLVDEAWPEFRRYVADTRRDPDHLGFPLDGSRYGLVRHRWRADGFEQSVSAPVSTLRRAMSVRRAGEGAPRRAADLAGTARVALALARLLGAEAATVTVAQSYLPALWTGGHLGGRRFDVLMTRLPAAVLEARLDAAAVRLPHRATLTDFRAPACHVEAEAEALAAADHIVTPHADIAALFGARAIKLEWCTPPGTRPGVPVRGRIGFAGPTIARKGADAVREAALALGLEVAASGAELEGPDFWSGVRMVDGPVGAPMAVVQPAFVEDAPRRLLAALAAGIPVIATRACGLDPQPGLVFVPPGDGPALIEALGSLLDRGCSGW